MGSRDSSLGVFRFTVHEIDIGWGWEVWDEQDVLVSHGVARTMPAARGEAFISANRMVFRQALEDAPGGSESTLPFSECPPLPFGN